MIETFAVGTALLALAVWVAIPLLGPCRPGERPSEASDLLESKHAVYRSMLDLEVDHRLGKVAEEDYRYLMEQHTAEATAILKQLDRAASEERVADTIEAEIAAARERLRER